MAKIISAKASISKSGTPTAVIVTEKPVTKPVAITTPARIRGIKRGRGGRMGRKSPGIRYGRKGRKTGIQKPFVAAVPKPKPAAKPVIKPIAKPMAKPTKRKK